MARHRSIATMGAALVALAACGGYEKNEQAYDEGNAAYTEGGEGYGDGQRNAAYSAGAATILPEGTRVVVENGVRYRVDPAGARVRIGDDESVIFVEDGVRFRVDPDGSRVRVDDDGDVDANIRLGDNVAVDVNTNRR
jgi:hypothetical protein